MAKVAKKKPKKSNFKGWKNVFTVLIAKPLKKRTAKAKKKLIRNVVGKR